MQPNINCRGVSIYKSRDTKQFPHQIQEHMTWNHAPEKQCHSVLFQWNLDHFQLKEADKPEDSHRWERQKNDINSDPKQGHTRPIEIFLICRKNI